jgi:hypothetical protein
MLSGKWLIFDREEREEDLNGDGDTRDSVCHVHDLETGQTSNLRLAVEYYQDPDDCSTGMFGWPPSAPYATEGGWVMVHVYEQAQGRDLDGDGRLESWVLHLHQLTTGHTTNLGLDNSRRDTCVPTPGRPRLLSGNWLLFESLESAEDLNGDGDTSDAIVHLADLAGIASLPRFIRGDCNADGNVDISDVLCTLNWLFLGAATPGCLAVTDTNGDAGSDVSDAVYLLGYLFVGGAAPVPPFPGCGPGVLPGDRALGCGTPPESCHYTPHEVAPGGNPGGQGV